MGSCGTRMQDSRKHVSDVLRQATLPIGGVLLAVILSGCTMKFGSPPLTERLQTLTVGEATKTEVLVALGQPRGDGGAKFLVAEGRPRDIWFYEYLLSDGQKVNLKMLLVFFQGETYDGHLWFSSVDKF